MNITSITNKELTIIEIFMTIVWRLIQPNSEIDNEEIINYVKFIRKNILIEKIFFENTHKYEVFLLSIAIGENYFKYDELLIEETVKKYISNSFLKKAILKLADSILEICKNTKANNIKEKIFYQDKEIELLSFDNKTYKILKNRVNKSSIWIKIVSNGIIKIEKDTIFENEGYYTSNRAVLQDIKVLTNECSGILITIQKSFLESMKISIKEDNHCKFVIPNIYLLQNIFKTRKEISPFKLLQEIIYLLQLTLDEKLRLVNVKYAMNKRIIIDTIERNLECEEREIIQKIISQLNISIPTFYKIFRGLFGETPTKYIMDRKLNKSCYYLKKNNELKDICSYLNFSENIFNKKFKEFAKCSYLNLKKILNDNLKVEYKEMSLKNREKLIKQLVIYTSQQILMLNEKDKNKLKSFYEQVISAYIKGDIGKYEVLLEELNIKEEIKKVIKELNIEIIKLMENSMKIKLVIQPKIIFQNKYLKVLEVEGESTIKFYSTYIHTKDMVMRIMLEGKIYYEEGFFLKENEYILTKPNMNLKKFKILSPKIRIIVFILKSEFIEKFKVQFPMQLLHSKIGNESREILESLKKENLYKNTFFFWETITLILKSNNLLLEDITLFSSILLDKNNWQEIMFEVRLSLKKNTKEIELEIMKKFKITRVILEKIVYKNTNLTFQRFVLKLKIDSIIEKYLNTNLSLEELISMYQLKSNSALEYNLKKIYSMSLANLKKIKCLY